jgi:hypothetical protein
MTTYNTTTIASSISNLKVTAQAHGVRFVAYEGGQTLYPMLGNVANKLAAQTDPRMKAETLALLNNWQAAGGDLFNYYSLCSGWGTYGYWGLSNDITYDIDADAGYPNSERFPKWGAIKQFVGVAPPPPPAFRRRVVRGTSGQ